jgi:hypothetical protein
MERGIAPKVVPCEVIKTLYENKAWVSPTFAPFRIVTDAQNFRLVLMEPGIATKVVPCEVLKTLYENKAQVSPTFAPIRIVTDAQNYPHCAKQRGGPCVSTIQVCMRIGVLYCHDLRCACEFNVRRLEREGVGV